MNSYSPLHISPANISCLNPVCWCLEHLLGTGSIGFTANTYQLIVWIMNYRVPFRITKDRFKYLGIVVTKSTIHYVGPILIPFQRNFSVSSGRQSQFFSHSCCISFFISVLMFMFVFFTLILKVKIKPDLVFSVPGISKGLKGLQVAQHCLKSRACHR